MMRSIIDNGDELAKKFSSSVCKVALDPIVVDKLDIVKKGVS